MLVYSIECTKVDANTKQELLLKASPSCCNFSGIWFNHPDPINSIKYNITQANGSCIVKGLHDCQFHNDSLAIGDVLHWCKNKINGTLKLAAPLLDTAAIQKFDQLRWNNGANWYREPGTTPCSAPPPPPATAEPNVHY
jgi:hypothetical protein